MRVIFRTDSSVSIGTGHVIRCLTLADQLRSQGAEVIFLCANLSGALLYLIKARGYVCAVLPQSVTSSSPADADETLAAAAGNMPGIVDWLVVDHYSLDFIWETRVRPCCHKLMVIDDIADRRHFCDLLLDQNYADLSRYQNLVNSNCKLLLGPKYALLRPEYAECRRPCEFRLRPLKRVFVFFGGSDPHDLTGKTLKALTTPSLSDLEVDVVVGDNYAHHEALRLLACERGQTKIYGPQKHLANFMIDADLAVGAGGVTNWERMTVGLPSLVITLARNQVPIAEQLHRRGIIRLIGNSAEVSVEAIKAALLDEVQSQSYLQRIPPSMALCDGKGTARVLHAMNSQFQTIRNR